MPNECIVVLGKKKLLCSCGCILVLSMPIKEITKFFTFSASPSHLICSTLAAKTTEQFLSSRQLYHSSCSSQHVPRIRAEDGQTINFHLINLNPRKSNDASYGAIIDEETQDHLPLTLRDQAHWSLGSSTSSSVSIIMEEVYDEPAFIIQYEGKSPQTLFLITSS